MAIEGEYRSSTCSQWARTSLRWVPGRDDSQCKVMERVVEKKEAKTERMRASLSSALFMTRILLSSIDIPCDNIHFQEVGKSSRKMQLALSNAKKPCRSQIRGQFRNNETPSRQSKERPDDDRKWCKIRTNDSFLSKHKLQLQITVVREKEKKFNISHHSRDTRSNENTKTHSATSASVNFLNTGVPELPVPWPPSVSPSNPLNEITPNSIVFSVMTPSKPSLSVRRAVWIASSSDKSSLNLRVKTRQIHDLERTYETHLFSRKVFALTWFFPIAVAFQA